MPPGVDEATQIERYDWNLHDFDIEVEPILRSLVGRCLQQSRIELIEEYETEEWDKARVRFIDEDEFFHSINQKIGSLERTRAGWSLSGLSFTIKIQKN